MPEAVTKAKSSEENSEAQLSGVEQLVQLVDNKLRNLNKRKNRLEEKQSLQARKGPLKPEEEEAVKKLGEVTLLLETYTEFEKQAKAIATTAAKADKSEARARDSATKRAEAARLSESLRLHELVFLYSAHRSSFAKGSGGAPKLSDEEARAMDAAKSRLFPSFRDIGAAEEDGAWDRLVDKAGLDMVLLQSASPKPFTGPKFSFKDLRHLLLEKIAPCELVAETMKGKRPPPTRKDSKDRKADDAPAADAPKNDGEHKAATAPKENKETKDTKGKGKPRNKPKAAKTPSDAASASDGPTGEAPKQQRTGGRREKENSQSPPKADEATAAASLVFTNSAIQPTAAAPPQPHHAAGYHNGHHNMQHPEAANSPSAMVPQSDIQFLQPEASEGGPPPMMVYGGGEQLLSLPPGSMYGQGTMATVYGQVYGQADLAVDPPPPIPLPTAGEANSAVPPPFKTPESGAEMGGRDAGPTTHDLRHFQGAGVTANALAPPIANANAQLAAIPGNGGAWSAQQRQLRRCGPPPGTFAGGPPGVAPVASAQRHNGQQQQPKGGSVGASGRFIQGQGRSGVHPPPPPPGY